MIKDIKLKETILRLTSWTAFLSFTVIIIVSFLIIINYLQITLNNPLDNTSITGLYERLKGNPEDENLKEEIRELDLMARKAFFTKQWQINTGGIIILAGSIILIASLKINFSLRKKNIPLNKTEVLFLNKNIIFYSVISFGIILLSTALITSFLTQKMIGGNFTVSNNNKSKSENKNDTKYRISWPALRGPYGLGKTGIKILPVNFNVSTGEGILWKQPLPKDGYNSPIIWDERIFLAGSDKNDIEIYSYDLNNGNMIWKKSIFEYIQKKEFPKVSTDTGYCASTMTTNGKYIYAIFPTGDLLCLDMDGNKIWTKDFSIQENIYGYASSLIIYNNILIVQYDSLEGGKLYGFNGDSGDILWENNRAVISSWSSPVIVIDGVKNPVIVINGNPLVTIHDLKTGRIIWSTECLSGDVAPSPAYSDGRIYSVNQNAKLSCMDINNGKILWEYYEELPDVCSPLALKDYIFLPTGYGVLTCLDAKNGNVIWSKEFEDGFYSSPVLSGDNIFLINRKGIMFVFKAGNKYEEVGQYDLGEPCVATPAIIDGKIIIRGYKNLYCIGGAK